MDDDLRRDLTACKLRTRSRSPFFSVLVSYLKVVQVSDNSQIDTAAVDGKHLFINKKFWLGIRPPERDFVLSHEAMHCALGHVWRVGSRHKLRWNVAADFVINLMLEKAGFLANCSQKFKEDMLLDHKYAGKTTEEVYEMLEGCVLPINSWADLLEAVGPAEAKKTWDQAKARAVAIDKEYGTTTAGRMLSGALEDTEQDWRAVIWRALSRDQSDFEEWDGRLVGDEIYVEALEPQIEKMRIALCVDTSGSTGPVMPKFLGIVKQIASFRKELEVDLFWADWEMVGPLPLSEMANPQGGGGTSFVPFFDYVEKDGKYDRAVYLTDLYGEFPKYVPRTETIWAVSPGGAPEVPFGKYVKIVG